MRREKSEAEKLNFLNFYYKNIKLLLEINPPNFLHTEVTRILNVIKTYVYSKERFSVHYTTKVPVNAIIGEQHRAKNISTDFNLEIKRVISKYVSACFP